MFFFQDVCQVTSQVKVKCTNADDVRTRLRHTPLVRLLRHSRHLSNVIYVMMRGAWIADAWIVESSRNDVVIIHAHNEVIVAFQHGSQM
jgi:hypothetical protein